MDSQRDLALMFIGMAMNAAFIAVGVLTVISSPAMLRDTCILEAIFLALFARRLWKMADKEESNNV